MGDGVGWQNNFLFYFFYARWYQMTKNDQGISEAMTYTVLFASFYFAS